MNFIEFPNFPGISTHSPSGFFSPPCHDAKSPHQAPAVQRSSAAADLKGTVFLGEIGDIMGFTLW